MQRVVSTRRFAVAVVAVVVSYGRDQSSVPQHLARACRNAYRGTKDRGSTPLCDARLFEIASQLAFPAQTDDASHSLKTRSSPGLTTNQRGALRPSRSRLLLSTRATQPTSTLVDSAADCFALHQSVSHPVSPCHSHCHSVCDALVARIVSLTADEERTYGLTVVRHFSSRGVSIKLPHTHTDITTTTTATPVRALDNTRRQDHIITSTPCSIRCLPHNPIG